MIHLKIVSLVLSVTSIFIGVIIISISKLVEEFTPKLGFAAYQSAAAGSYSPDYYDLDLSLNYWLGTLCILVGAGFALFGPMTGLFKKYAERVKELNKEYGQQNKDV